MCGRVIYISLLTVSMILTLQFSCSPQRHKYLETMSSSQNNNYQPPAWHRAYNSDLQDEKLKKLGAVCMAMDGHCRGGGLTELIPLGTNLDELVEKDDGRCFHGYPIPPFR